MKFLISCFLFLGVAALAEERVKRQASYTFPGPRSDRSYRPSLSAAPVYVAEHEAAEVYPATRRQSQPQYAAAQPRAPVQQAVAAPAPPPPEYEPAPRQQAAPRAQSSSAASRRRGSSSAASNRANKYGSAPQQSLNGHAEDDEEEAGPDPLTLLLEDSQFTCGGKQDGYYADDSVNCQVFHYCVGGAKHSWMCPENTVFHQVHLNCVPDSQDICAQSQKFHFVNEYLYKPIDYEGPNNTARYSQRYYPDGYVVGDPLVAPQPQEPRRPAAQPPPPQYQPAPAPRPQPRPQPRPSAPAPPPPSYRAPQPAPQPRPQPRPSRPLESYPVEEPREYRPQPPPQSASQTYRGSPAQPQGPPPQGYRVASAPQSRPQSAYTSSEEAHYQPESSPQSRRQAASPQPPQRATAGYAPRQQQYRQPQPQQTARSGSGYQPYASNQAAGVEYDEDY